MAVLMLSFLCLITGFVYNVIPGIESSNFPLDDCSRTNMDVLALFYYTGDYRDIGFQSRLFSVFINHISSFPNNGKSPRMLATTVYDVYSKQNPNVTVSSWSFNLNFKHGIFGKVDIHRKMRSIQEVLKAKITFVQRLFSEMAGVRENTTHISIIFLDGNDFSYNHGREIPHFLQQQNVEVKIFVVVIGGKHGQSDVYMDDTLYLPQFRESFSSSLVFVICNSCLQEWISFKHSVGTNSLSCYQLFDFHSKKKNWFYSEENCGYYTASLVGIETQDELHFLQKWFYSYIEYRSISDYDHYNSSQFSALVYIGLKRNSASIAKRFRWSLRYPIQYRPLVVNNWMRGKPSGGYNNACGAWQFDWNRFTKDTNFSIIGDRLNEGWTDVSCSSKLTALSLCETVFPRKRNDDNFMRINLATEESVSKALRRGELTKFYNNVVSVSAQITSTSFLKMLKETGDEFPIFYCGDDASDSQYISYVYVCDYIDHCSNRRDELFCTHDKNDNIITTECSVYCCDGSCLPLQWVNDGEIDCRVCEYSTENEINDENEILHVYLKGNITCAFQCGLDTCLQFSQLNDGRKDCFGPDGPLDETIGKLETANTCYNVLGHKIWAPMCVYVKDRSEAIVGCRDVSHLNGCVDFECPEGYFKCPHSYCILQHYVLDGKEDCPQGEEEQTDFIDLCSGNFACWNSRMCLHPDQVCDGHPECPHEDDEVGCDMSCDKGFRCVSGTITVLDYQRSIPLVNLNFTGSRTYLDLSGVDLSVFDFLSSTMIASVLFINWSNCKIRNLAHMLFSSSRGILKLDISYNLIQTFKGSETGYKTLHNIRHFNLSHNKELIIVNSLPFRYLETLDLSNTGLSYLDESFLQELPNLKHLILSYTSIFDFQIIIFSSNLTIQTLDLRGVPIDNLCEDYFNGLTISQHLYTNNFEICCPQIRGTNIPYYNCHGPPDAISSCFDLIRINVQRIILWLVGVFAVLGNLTVIVYRVYWDTSVLKTGYGMFVINLGVSDFIMGVYLFIIAGADYYYRGTYVLYDKNWRESAVCRIAGFLATLSIETSTFLVFLITLDRFLIMKFPFGQIGFSKISKIIVLVSSWITGFILALIPVVFKFEIYSSNTVCLGLPFTAEHLNGWEYSFSMFVVLNFLMFLFIAYGQIAIFRAMSENRINRSHTSAYSRRPEDVIVAKQLSLVALSTFICWCPLGILGLLSLGKYEISNDGYAWITVIVLPINSAANPILYTIPALVAKWEKLRHGTTRSH